MEKTFIKIDNNGKIISIITSNDPTLIIGDGKNIFDITNFKDKEKLQNNLDYFVIKDNKIVELTTAEKKIVDDAKKIILEVKENPLIAEINDLKARLEKLESKK